VARRLAALLALWAAAVLAAAGPAEARHGCGAARSEGARIVVKTREAVVFTKGSFVYGCLASVGTVRRLPDEGGGIDLTPPDGPVLSGRYVAYATFGSAIGDEFDRLYVYDLRLGRRFLVVGSNFIRAIVLKRNGSVAWIEGSTVAPADPDQPSFQVRKFGNEERQGAVLLDRGSDVDPDSLTLAADRLSIGWVRGGTDRTAPLR
jgi:hypothetical protein